MQLGMIGLGKMGSNMARRLMRGGHSCVVFDLDEGAVRTLEKEGATPSDSVAGLVAKLEPPRAVWLMVPAGDATEKVVEELAEHLEKGDVVVDGGNSYFKDGVRRARELRAKGIHFSDVGTSGGVWGLERGYCLMIGAEDEVAERLEPLFRTLAPGLGEVERTPRREEAARRGRLDPTAEHGYLHCGPPGAGHFVKMIHNGVEYGIMQAYAEGFDLLRGQAGEQLAPEHRFELEVADVAEVWRRGSVVGSWLLDLTARALAESPDLEEFSGFVHDSGEGRWTVQAAVESAVSAEVLTAALYARFRSRREHTFAEKVLSAMRKGFGGHEEKGS
jgi:6-phosphogluconate dehydrogenase